MRFLLWTLFAGAMLAAPARAADVHVFAAASLKDALDEQATRWRPGGPDRVRLSYAASSALARQIENGAPAQLFISADEEWMDYLQARGLVEPRTRVELLSNRLVLVTPAAAPVRVDLAVPGSLAAALGHGRMAVADPDHVPAGRYARSALEALGAWTELQRRLARAENVRAALALVARGEAPLGIVYRTDALAERRVQIAAEFPPSSHPPIRYPAALTSPGNPAAPFLEFLRSPAAAAIWRKHGFAVIP